MILQALTKCYDLMAEDASFDVARPGYSGQDCSFAIVIDSAGTVKSVIDLRDGKRKEQHIVPQQKDRSSNILAYFLCDNVKYLFGKIYDKKRGVLEKNDKNLRASAQLHEEVLTESDDDGAKAVLRFFAKCLDDEPLLLEENHDFYTGGFALFKLEGSQGYIHERPAVKSAWQSYYSQEEKDGAGIYGQCLITGREEVVIVHTHAKTKGILGGKTGGGSLVSFNSPSVESYGKKQSYNAPVSEEAMFRYTTALNKLLIDEDNKLIIGDMTCVFWSEKEVRSPVISRQRSIFGGNMETEEKLKIDKGGRREIRGVLLRYLFGNIVDAGKMAVDEKTNTYILGLAPNAARLSVRFWYKDTYGHFVEHLATHYDDMEIVKSEREKPFVAVQDILRSMAVAGESKNIPKAMQRSLLQSIVSGCMYPVGVYTNILLRIRAEAGDYFAVNRTRAGMIKAFLKRKYRKADLQKKEEEITVALNEDSTSIPYQLGRLFATLEKLQESAGSKNLREKYFASASTNPNVVFPSILKLAQSHLMKVMKNNPQIGVYFDKICGGILEKMDENNAFPKCLDMEEQGMFILGYYHQRQFFYTPKVKQELDIIENVDETEN